HRWVSAANQYPNESVRGSLAAVDVVARAAGARPLVLIVNDGDTDDPATHTNTAYGWAKTYTNVFRTGLPGTSAKYQATYLGSLENFRAGRRRHPGARPVVAAGRRGGGGERRRERHRRGARAPPRTARQPPSHAARDRDPRPAPGRARRARATLVRARLDDRSVRADPG